VAAGRKESGKAFCELIVHDPGSPVGERLYDTGIPLRLNPGKTGLTGREIRERRSGNQCEEMNPV
jgi:hypothetical protein